MPTLNHYLAVDITSRKVYGHLYTRSLASAQRWLDGNHVADKAIKFVDATESEQAGDYPVLLGREPKPGVRSGGRPKLQGHRRQVSLTGLDAEMMAFLRSGGSSASDKIKTAISIYLGTYAVKRAGRPKKGRGTCSVTLVGLSDEQVKFLDKPGSSPSREIRKALAAYLDLRRMIDDLEQQKNQQQKDLKKLLDKQGN